MSRDVSTLCLSPPTSKHHSLFRVLFLLNIDNRTSVHIWMQIAPRSGAAKNWTAGPQPLAYVFALLCVKLNPSPPTPFKLFCKHCGVLAASFKSRIISFRSLFPWTRTFSLYRTQLARCAFIMIIVMMMDIYANLTLLFRWQIRAAMNNEEKNANLEHFKEGGSLRISSQL